MSEDMGHVQLNFGEVEGLLANLYDIAASKRPTFQARLRKFLTYGIPNNVSAGRGKQATFDAGALTQMVLALELTRMGLEPSEVHLVLSEDYYFATMAVYMACGFLMESPEGFDPDQVQDSDPASMFLWVQTDALASLTKNSRELAFYYSGLADAREALLSWTTGERANICFINVTNVLWRTLNLVPLRMRTHFLSEVRAWADNQLHGDDFSLDAWVQEAIRNGVFRSRSSRPETSNLTLGFQEIIAAHGIPHVRVPEQSDGELKPDGIFQLPGQREIYIDAKVPTDGLLEAVDSKLPRAVRKMVAQTVSHVEWLMTQPYRSQFTDKSGYVIAFLPSYFMFEQLQIERPYFWEEAFNARVIVASIADLSSMIRVAQLAWEKEELLSATEEIVRFAASPAATPERLGEMLQHFECANDEDGVNGDR